MKRTNITLTYNELVHIKKCLEDNREWNEDKESSNLLLEKIDAEIMYLDLGTVKENE